MRTRDVAEDEWGRRGMISGEREASKTESRGGPRVLWVSHAYGYHGDLMYYGEIFRLVRERLPNMAVAVDRETPYLNPYGIDLQPMLSLWPRAVQRRTDSGQIYEMTLLVPKPGLLQTLRKAPVDVIITIEFTLPALIATLAVKLSRRKRLVLLIESDPKLRGTSKNPLIRIAKRWAARRADVIQTNNEKGRDYIVGTLGADPKRVRVAPYLSSRPPGPPTTIEAAPGPLRLLFLNSIVPRKGLRETIAALHLLDPEIRAGIDLTVVGDGREREELEELAAGLGLGDRLRFVGRKGYAEVYEYYGAADVLLIPSLADYRSLAGFEGLAYGLVLLASVHDGATEETVIEGVNGYSIDPHDPAHFAALITSLVSDRAKVMRMRAASLALYNERFSLEAVGENIAESVAIATAR